MSAGARRYDDRHKPILILFVAIFTVAAWFFAVHMTYEIPPDRRLMAYFYALLATTSKVELWLPPLLAFSFGMTIFIIIIVYTRTGFDGADFVMRLRGPRMVSPSELKDITTEWFTKQLTLMGIPVPTNREPVHFQVVGSTGTGKSQVIEDYLESAHKRKDRTIVIDPNGGFMSKFWQENDIVLNPFDARGIFWSIFNEIISPYDVEQFAVAMIPKSPNTEAEQWNAMARTIVAEVMLKLAKLGQTTTERLVYWLATATNDQLQNMLADTAAAGMFHGAEETLGSVRTVLTRYVTPHKFLSENLHSEEVFSIRNWLINGEGNLWVTWREDMLPALKPLISCWIDVICAASLSSKVGATKVIHLVIDELDSLEKLNYLVPAATKARKHKLRIFTGLQSYAQLDETNGKNDALTLRNSLRNTVSLGIAEMDTYTAEQISKGLGEHEVVREKHTLSSGAGGKASTTMQTDPEYMVKPSEIHGLPDLTGYLKFAGDIPFSKVRMTYKDRPTRIEPLILIDGKWTKSIAEQQAAKSLFKKIEQNVVV